MASQNQSRRNGGRKVGNELREAIRDKLKKYNEKELKVLLQALLTSKKKRGKVGKKKSKK